MRSANIVVCYYEILLFFIKNIFLRVHFSSDHCDSIPAAWSMPALLAVLHFWACGHPCSCFTFCDRCQLNKLSRKISFAKENGF